MFSHKSKTSSIKTASAPDDWSYLEPRYKFLEVAGRGGFGTVYKAKDRQLRQIVAVKHIKDIFKHNYAAKKVFRELSILKQLSNLDFKCNFIAKLLKVVIPVRGLDPLDGKPLGEKLSETTH